MKVSIILPCYNVAPYVARCLDSIEQQDLPQDEYEVICVDDCSTDNTVGVIKDYQKQYDNIRLICHKENKTAGGARNTGLNAAQGEFIWFVDPDDTIENAILGMLINTATTKALDVVLFGYNVYDEQGKWLNSVIYDNSQSIMDGVSFMETCFPGNLSKICMVWNVLYRKAFILNNDCRFPLIKASQDVVFAWKTLICAERVCSIDNVVYSLHKRKDSTTGRVGRNGADKIYSRTVLFPLEVVEIYNRVSSEVIRLDFSRTIRWSVNDTLNSLSKADRKERKKYYNSVFQSQDEACKLIKYMNKATKMLLTNRIPFYAWDLERFVLGIIKHV